MFGNLGKSLSMSVSKCKAIFSTEVKYYEIPKEKLQIKSSNKINDYIDMYYINRAKELLSVLRNEDNDTLEIIRKLSSISEYFNPNFRSLIISKTTGKLLGYEYTFEFKEKDFTTVASIVSDSEEVYNVLNEIKDLDRSQGKGFLVKVLYIYKILKYLNKQGISVKELNIADLDNGTINKKICSLNAIAKLKLTNIDETNEIISLCLEYIKNADINNYISYEFKEYISSNNILDFEKQLIKQIHNIKKFECGDEFDSSFLRCPICNKGDFIIEDNELNTLNKPEFSYDKISIYKVDLENKDNGIVLFNNLSADSLDTLKEYMSSIGGKYYDVIYNEKLEFVGLRILNNESFKFITSTDYLKEFFDKKDFPKKFNFEKFFNVFLAIEKEINELNNNNLYVKFDEGNLLEQFIVINGKFHGVFVIPTSITKTKFNKFPLSKLVVEIIFSYFKENIDNSNKVALVDPILYIEYEKYLSGQNFDYIKVYNRILQLNNNSDFYEVISNEGYSNLYKVSPDDVDVKILEAEELKIPEGYELCKTDLDESFVKFKDKSCDFVYPKTTIYRLERNEIVYEGYIIKKTSGIPVLEAFSNTAYSNKEFINMLKLYRQEVKNNKELPVRYAYFNDNFTEIFYKYITNYSLNASIKEYFYELVEDLKSSDIYLSDAIEISLNRNGKIAINGLDKLLKELTNYCKEHNTWYEKNIKKCPICSKYYLYVNISDATNVVYENDFWKLIKYKNRYVKLFKKNTLESGKKVSEIGIEILGNESLYSKILKDSDSETTIGLIMKHEISSLKKLLCYYKNTNKTYLHVAINLLKEYKNFYFYFDTNENVEKLFEDKIFIYSDKVFYIDTELYTQMDTSKKMYCYENMLLLEKMIKYILSYNSKYAEEFSGIEYPEINFEYIDNLYEILTDLDKSMTEFCNEHNVYYNPNLGMCPSCVDFSDKMVLTKKTQLGKLKGKGGEAQIYQLGLSRLAKIYNYKKSKDKNEVSVNEYVNTTEESIREKRSYVIESLEEVYEATKDDLKKKEFGIIFPQKYILFNDILGGFIQERVKDPISFAYISVEESLKFERIDILKLLIEFGEAIEYLHNSPIIRKIIPNGIVVGDINGYNALYSKYDKKVYLIDMDSVCLKEYPHGDFFSLKYYDPLMEDKKPNFGTDWYAYAIMCFYNLTNFHPFDGTYVGSSGEIMSLVDRKINKISVLGKKKIKLPNPVEDKWMSKELKKAFLDIFEKEKRFSIVDLLKKEYNRLAGEEKYTFEKEIVLKSTKIDPNKELSVIDNKIFFNNVALSDINYNPLEEKVPTELIKDIKVNEKHGVLFDRNNGMYLILSNNDSYVIYNERVENFKNVYKTNLNEYEIKRYIEEGKVKNLFYVGNCLYYLVDGYISCIDLMKSFENKVTCDCAKYGGFIRIIDNKIFVGDDCIYYVYK